MGVAWLLRREQAGHHFPFSEGLESAELKYADVHICGVESTPQYNRPQYNTRRNHTVRKKTGVLSSVVRTSLRDSSKEMARVVE